MSRFWNLWPMLLCLPLAGCNTSTESSSTVYPRERQAIKLIVPFAPGGGSDAFARVLKQAIDDNHLLPVPLVIYNVGGAGGTIGSRRVRDAKADGHTVLLLHDAIVTAQYTGTVEYGPEAFQPVAGTGLNTMVVAVAASSGSENLTDLLHRAREAPDTVRYGASLGTPSYFAGLLLEQSHPGASFRFVRTEGGAHRFAQLKGGHIQMTVFSVEEFKRFEAGGLRALAVLAKERNAALPDVPSAFELGFDVQLGVMHYWWVPKNTSSQRVEYLAEVLQKAMQTPEVRQMQQRNHIEPVFLRGEPLQERLDDVRARVSSVDLREPVNLPNLPLIIGVAMAGLLGARLLQRRAPRIAPGAPAARTPALWCWCGLSTIAYVTTMGLGWVGFRLATTAFVVLLGGALAEWRPRRLLLIVPVAVLLGFGLQYLFTDVFSVDLP